MRKPWKTVAIGDELAFDVMFANINDMTSIWY